VVWPEGDCAAAGRVDTAKIAASNDHVAKFIETPKQKVSHARETGSKAKTAAFRAGRTPNLGCRDAAIRSCKERIDSISFVYRQL